MLRRSRFPWMIILALGVFPSCSGVSRFVRHSDPLTTEQHMQLGATYESQGLAEAADHQYEAAFRMQKKYSPALIARGNLAFAAGDLKTAEACYRQVLRFDRYHAGANNNLAMVLLARGKNLDKAERYAQIAFDQGGLVRPYALETMAAIYIQQGRFTEARQLLDEAEVAAPAVNTTLNQQIAETRKRVSAGE